MQTTSMHTPARRGGALVRTVRAVGRWISRSVNALGQPYANADADPGSTGRGSRRSELVLLMERGSRDHQVLRHQDRRYGTNSGMAKSALIATPSCSHPF